VDLTHTTILRLCGICRDNPGEPVPEETFTQCGSYRGIKLLEHAMKVVERTFKQRIRQHIDIDDMQFRFMKGKETTDAIFIVRQMQEKYRAKGKKLYFAFVDLEKAFDRVPREEVRWAMHKLRIEEWLVLAVMSMYTGAKTVVRTIYGNSNGFEVKVGMHQDSCKSFAICDCHGSLFQRIQNCLSMGVVVRR